MNRRLALAVLGALLPGLLTIPAANAQRRTPRPAPAPEVLPDTMQIAMTTEAGRIVIELDLKNAPVTARNFLRYADQRRFDGTVFYRVMRLAWGVQPNGLIQGGTRGDPARVLPPIAHEPTSQTGILHKAGTLSMARFAPGTATGDFSILLSDLEGLDADPASDDADRRAGFATFGRVIEGMEVVRAIWDAPLSPTAGQGVLKGQMLEKPVRILTVRRLPAPITPPPYPLPSPLP